jgi:hypothetical protein
MGLTITVGALSEVLQNNDAREAAWLREVFFGINEVLKEAGLSEHEEPETIAPHRGLTFARCAYSSLNYFRCLYAFMLSNPGRSPGAALTWGDRTEQPVLRNWTPPLSSHLLHHSDCEGFYLPIEFDEVLFDTKNLGRIPGGVLGSSFRLIEELVSIAPQVGIIIENGNLSDREVEKICQEREAESEFSNVKAVWLSLFEAARLSIESKSAILFC